MIVAGMNSTSNALRISFRICNTGLMLLMNTSVEFPRPPTITRDTEANRKVVESLSPALR